MLDCWRLFSSLARSGLAARLGADVRGARHAGRGHGRRLRRGGRRRLGRLLEPGGLALGACTSASSSTAASGTRSRDDGRRGRTVGHLVALATPPLGLSYYRLSARPRVAPVTTAFAPRPVHRVESLTTHHAGVTLVQSLTDGFAVGDHREAGTRHCGVGRGDRPPTATTCSMTADDLSEPTPARSSMPTSASWRCSAASRRADRPQPGRAGVRDAGTARRMSSTARRARAWRSPGQRLIAGGGHRSRRAPVAWRRVPQLAIGAERGSAARVRARRACASTRSPKPGGHAPVFSVGGSFAAFRSLWSTARSPSVRRGDRGWGIAGLGASSLRTVYRCPASQPVLSAGRVATYRPQFRRHLSLCP